MAGRIQGITVEIGGDTKKLQTAYDFFRFCAMGYAENGYAGCEKSPKEQYYLHADGRDDGLGDIDPDDPEAFRASGALL